MAKSLESVKEYIEQTLGDKLLSSKLEYGELTLEVPVDQWVEVARFLRHDEKLAFAQLTDLCGVDYLAYKDVEWDVITASSSGFSRAVNADTPDPFAFDNPQTNKIVDGKRFAVVIHLLSFAQNVRVRVKTFCADNEAPTIPTIVDVWSCANWYEREAFDMVGIMFEGHPDLRRILTDYGFIGHPLRKDFPCIGQVEMRYDNEQARCVYEPVSIDPRVLVPRSIRHDDRFSTNEERKN